MTRDMDLIRKILFKVEEANTFDRPIRPFEIEGYSPEIVWYHVMLLSQAGYITAHEFSGDDQSIWFPISLTWNGHEFINAARDDSRWEKAKTIILQNGGAMVVEILKSLLVSLATQTIGLGGTSPTPPHN